MSETQEMKMADPAAARLSSLWFWIVVSSPVLVTVAIYAFYFDQLAISINARLIADSLLVELFSRSVFLEGVNPLFWKLTQAPYLFPDVPMVALGLKLGPGMASGVYPAFAYVLISAGWIWCYRLCKLPALLVFAVPVTFAALLFSDQNLEGHTYAYAFLPGHHGGYFVAASLALFLFAKGLATAGRVSMVWLALSSVYLGLCITGDASSVIMFIGPFLVLSFLLAIKKMISWPKFTLLLASLILAYLLGQIYQQIAVFPTLKGYQSDLLHDLRASASLKNPSAFFSDVVHYFLNPLRGGIWFVVPLITWGWCCATLYKFVTGPRRPMRWVNYFHLSAVSCLVMGFPVSLVLQVLVIGYPNAALSRQFVSFLMLGYALFWFQIGMSSKWRAGNPVAARLGARQFGLFPLAFSILLIAAAAVRVSVALNPSDWKPMAGAASCMGKMAKEAGVTSLMLPYWTATPVAIYNPGLRVDNYIADLLYMDPRDRDPYFLKGGQIQAYGTDSIFMPKEEFYTSRFGPASRRLACEADGRQYSLLLFEGDKAQTYNQWLTSYAPEITPRVRQFPAAPLTFHQPAQFGKSSYAWTAAAHAGGGSLISTPIRLPAGAYKIKLKFSGINSLLISKFEVRAANKTIFEASNLRPVNDAVEVTVDNPFRNKWTFKSLEVAVAPNSDFVFEGLEISPVANEGLRIAAQEF